MIANSKTGNSVLVRHISLRILAVHFPEDPVRTSDVLHYWIDWLDQYLK
jgi:hypothetical protein